MLVLCNFKILILSEKLCEFFLYEFMWGIIVGYYKKERNLYFWIVCNIVIGNEYV